MITEKDALKIFKKYLVNACPVKDCKAAKGKLCATKSVWIHHERFQMLAG